LLIYWVSVSLTFTPHLILFILLLEKNGLQVKTFQILLSKHPGTFTFIEVK